MVDHRFDDMVQDRLRHMLNNGFGIRLRCRCSLHDWLRRDFGDRFDGSQELRLGVNLRGNGDGGRLLHGRVRVTFRLLRFVFFGKTGRGEGEAR